MSTAHLVLDGFQIPFFSAFVSFLSLCLSVVDELNEAGEEEEEEGRVFICWTTWLVRWRIHVGLFFLYVSKRIERYSSSKIPFIHSFIHCTRRLLHINRGCFFGHSESLSCPPDFRCLKTFLNLLARDPLRLLWLLHLYKAKRGCDIFLIHYRAFVLFILRPFEVSWDRTSTREGKDLTSDGWNVFSFTLSAFVTNP